MAFVVLVLMVFFCAVAFRQQMKRDKVNAGEQDQLIRKILSRYRTLREHQDEVKTNAFVIGPAQEEYKGSLRNKRSTMAVRILDDKGTRRDGAAELGMEVLEIGGKYFYQFLVDQEKEMENAEYVAVLTRIKVRIEERYPDDFVGRAPDYLTVVVDGKKLLKYLDH